MWVCVCVSVGVCLCRNTAPEIEQYKGLSATISTTLYTANRHYVTSKGGLTSTIPGHRFSLSLITTGTESASMIGEV